MGSVRGHGQPRPGARWRVSRASLQKPVLLEVAFVLGSVPNNERTILSPNLRRRCQTTALLVCYQFFF